MHYILCLLSVLILAGCTARGPETPQVPHGKALHWDEPMRGTVVKVWDGLHFSKNPNVSHLIEVELLDAPQQYIGQTICFPYDEWSVGEAPPEETETVVFMPSRWVRVSPESMGRPRQRY